MSRTPSVRAVTGLVAAVPVAVLLAACGGGETGAIVHLTATPVAGAPGPADSPSASEEPSPSEAPSPSEEPSPEPRDPTDTDRARFVAAYQPEGAADLDHVASDLDGDGVEEIVFAYVRSDRSRVDVAWWDGFAYAVTASVEGGAATRVDRLRIGDVTGDGRIEVVAFESAGGADASLTVWQVRGRDTLAPLRAEGGCADGSATYGVIGAALEDRDGDGSFEIYATCDDSPLPRSAWSTDRYLWSGGAYTYSPPQVSEDGDDG